MRLAAWLHSNTMHAAANKCCGPKCILARRLTGLSIRAAASRHRHLSPPRLTLGCSPGLPHVGRGTPTSAQCHTRHNAVTSTLISERLKNSCGVLCFLFVLDSCLLTRSYIIITRLRDSYTGITVAADYSCTIKKSVTGSR